MTKRRTFARLSLLFILKSLVFHKLFLYLCSRYNTLMRIIMVTLTGMKRGNGRAARVISARVRLSGRTDKPKSEVLTIEEFERRAQDGTL